MESLYKIGDIVKIKQLSKNKEGYRFGVNEEMEEASGKIFEIEDVVLSNSSLTYPKPDDGFRYTLRGSRWSWASSMFEESSTKKTTKSKTKKSKTKISFHKKKEIKFNFNL